MSVVLVALAVALGAAPVTYALEGGALKLPGPLVFEVGKATLKPESDAVLDFVKGYLEAKPAVTLLRVEGHTDSMGDPAANQALSEARAASVVAALVNRGVDCGRLLAVGFGGAKPTSPNDTPEGRALNRRMVFVNAALRGRPIGGLPIDGGGKAVPGCQPSR